MLRYSYKHKNLSKRTNIDLLSVFSFVLSAVLAIWDLSKCWLECYNLRKPPPAKGWRRRDDTTVYCLVQHIQYTHAHEARAIHATVVTTFVLSYCYFTNRQHYNAPGPTSHIMLRNIQPTTWHNRFTDLSSQCKSRLTENYLVDSFATSIQMLGEIGEENTTTEVWIWSLFRGCEILPQEEIEKPDPALKAPDLYQAIKENATNKALELFDEEVPLSYVEEHGYWTVKFLLEFVFTKVALALGRKTRKCEISETYYWQWRQWSI